ncbi:hypothetical protein MTO96_025562 [Rhipicephalus appendiculatus]
MPTVSSMAKHIHEFKAMLGFPQSMGALDRCHFPISPPKENATDYRNYKGWYSMILLALVDHKYRFRYIKFGSPGRCYDSYWQVQSREPCSADHYSPSVKHALPPLILYNQAFSLTGNLIKLFSHRAHLSDEQRLFNHNLSKAQHIVENAFATSCRRIPIIPEKAVSPPGPIAAIPAARHVVT